ncbi:hypothetical protein H4R99_000732 [Coemansia sp. RSA 1722]|nr:hypothetical protein LPJ57_000204 [Coemansia sp. RSA 486]KAJ2237741.1 hypothetical protein IWW45_000626 [Coemansia sp. RSA 485]KAJ2602505.1 hypothetical protein GGF39_000716 [Coemansia sp. RSA 1721]KAJ2606027.1 hypothetical protein H4R99_000732 [Coemansia sp. RSA 1722]KAJ2639583.1 hypothetical protein GGF40_000695 [Coemansia sp. RSA 1286]
MGISNNSRLVKELRILQSELPPGIICSPKGDNIDRYEARIDGPADTPYKRGQFYIDIELPSQYPIEPPSMTFRTRIYHPNIDENGNICLEVLKTGKNGRWDPSWTLGKVLISLTLLLATPNPQDPLVPDIAAQMLDDHSAFVETARQFTEKYALPFENNDNDDEEEDNDGCVANVGKRNNSSAVCVAETTMTGRSVVGKSRATGPGHTQKTNKRKLGLSRKTTSSATPQSQQEPSSSLSSLLATRPPTPGTLVSSTPGIRRLGLSRSRTAAAAAAKPTVSSRSPSLHLSSTASVSQAESVEVISDDGFPEDIGPCALMSPPSKKPRVGKLSEILASSKRRSPSYRPKLSLTRPKKQRPREDPGISSTGDSGMEASAESQQDIIGSPSADEHGLGFECLLSPQDSNADVRMVTQSPSGYTKAALTVIETMQDSLSEQLSEPVFVDSTESLIKDSEDEEQQLDKTAQKSAIKGSETEVNSKDAKTKEEVASATFDIADTAEPKLNDRSECTETIKVPKTTATKDNGKGKGKGKGKESAVVVSGSCSARPTLAPPTEAVLLESHFGPLDLGLPPIKTSAQRRLMRRTKRTT